MSTERQVWVELGVGAQTHYDVALSEHLANDEARYARNLALGMLADDEEMRWQAASIEFQRQLLAMHRQVLSMKVLWLVKS